MLVMVLNDNETYTDLAGCAIVNVPDTVETDEVESFLREAIAERTDAVITVFA